MNLFGTKIRPVADFWISGLGKNFADGLQFGPIQQSGTLELNHIVKLRVRAETGFIAEVFVYERLTRDQRALACFGLPSAPSPAGFCFEIRNDDGSSELVWVNPCGMTGGINSMKVSKEFFPSQLGDIPRTVSGEEHFGVGWRFAGRCFWNFFRFV